MEKISVLIPTYNAENYIEELIDCLYKQELEVNQQLEIIIVDSSSKDRTVDIISKHYPEIIVEVIQNNEFDHGGTRNLLVSLASGNYLLFMTQDAIPYDNFLIKNLVGSFGDSEILVSYARQIPKKDAKSLEVFARNFNYPPRTIIKDKKSIPELGIKAFFNSNVCSMYKADVFKNYSGFREKIILNEDMILASEIILSGFKVCYNAKAKVYHSHNYNLKQQFKRYFDIGMAFNETSYLLKYVSNEKEGYKMVFSLLKYLLSSRKIHLIPYSMLEVVVKYIGYNLGKRSDLFSNKIKKRFSAYMK